MDGKKVTVIDLLQKKQQQEPITMVTAYDVSSAEMVDAAGIDMILVGDSLGMVIMGLNSTVSVTMDEMLHHCRAVSRGASRAFLVGDMPFMSYQADESEAIRNAGRFLKEAGMDAVKLEGGREMAPTIKAIVRAGIPVIGHIGLTPQLTSKLGGYRIQGKTAAAAADILTDALTLENAGCSAIVLEAIPASVAHIISERLSIPTIGIGAGPHCDGQVLVYHDLLGLHPNRLPRFVRQYAVLRPQIIEALSAYRDDVRARAFPDESHSYPMSSQEEAEFLARFDEPRS